MLDAARECVLAVGVRRTTFSDVARRAGVSRMTLYRRFGDLEALLSALMTREFGRLVAAAQPQNGGGARASGPWGWWSAAPAGWRPTRCSSASSTSIPSCCCPT